MKHGQKAKGKAAKAKASTKTSSAVKKKSKISQSTRPKERATSAPRGHPSAEGAGFNNPTIATAFRRAVKKYPNAFRRLTD